jgi:hypothetical protein
MAINAVSAAVANSVKVAVIVTSTAAQELPKEAGELYFVSTTTACYLKAGAAAVGAATASDFTYFFPANFWGLVRIPGDYVRVIRDTADGTLVLTNVREDNVAT